MASAQVPLTADEIRQLDGADGLSDGKFHGVDIADLKHDLGKSSDGWEMKDGKWYKRDYYAASKTQAQVAVTDERDQIIATLRRELAEKDAIIAELRATITTKVEIITRLESERSRFLAVIASLEEQLRLAQQNQQIVVQQAPAAVAVDTAKSYYVVRSQRGAELLSMYGKNDIVVNPFAPPVMGAGASVIAPPVVAAPAPIFVEAPAQQQVVQTIQVQQPAVQIQQVQQQKGASLSQTQQEYYRVADEEARRRLDMMDGKLDGKLDGTDIRVTGGAAFGGASGGAAMSGGAQSSSYSFSTTTVGGAVSGGAQMSGQEYYRVNDEEALRRLDMMDGKADGKFNGTDIQIK